MIKKSKSHWYLFEKIDSFINAPQFQLNYLFIWSRDNSMLIYVS